MSAGSINQATSLTTSRRISGSLFSRNSGGVVRGSPKHFRGQVLPSQRSKNAVGDTVRQLVGPLVDGLIRNADCICGGGDGPAEKFDGFGLEHAPLNHSSWRSATMVQLTSVPALMSPAMVATMVAFKDRLAHALDLEGVDMRDLANHLDVSYNAVKKLLAGTSKTMSAPNNAKTAVFLRVDSHWLAVGEGVARPEIDATQVRGIERQLLTLFRAIPGDDQDNFLTELNNVYCKHFPERSGANPFPAAKPPAKARRVKPEVK